MKTGYSLAGVFFLLMLLGLKAGAQEPLITNINSRNISSLNGEWQYIVDPYETGFYNYRWAERAENDPEAYWNSDVPENKLDKKEHGYHPKYTLRVPGDWNSQDPKFLYYEGTVWYKRSFDYKMPATPHRTFLYFGAVNYLADVYLNGKKLGSHKGGFTPFNFEIPGKLLKASGNFLVVKVDNKRKKDEIPTLNTDWWNYGGITRDVNLVLLPKVFVTDYSVRLKKDTENEVTGWIKLSAPSSEKISVEIPELKLNKQFSGIGDSIPFSFRVSNLQLWSPENPKLYKVIISSNGERITDKIGFRTIEVKAGKILLNGRDVFLRGICLHEEVAKEGRRAYSRQDAARLFAQVSALNANMVRLAHYPHNEYMTRMADSLGILVWSEIPVYWTIDFTNDTVLAKAKKQLEDMVTRDHNRASIIIWSVGNETPVHETRTKFMSSLVNHAKSLDSSRLVAAALEVHSKGNVHIVDDPLGQFTDIVAVNEYLGWYGGLPSEVPSAKWEIKYNKPLFFSETGAGALGGFHEDSLTRWSEAYQAWFYREQVAMMKRMPGNFVGLSPWVLNDFRSPRRNNPVYQDGWNVKGLFDRNGNKKKAFYVLKDYYDEMENLMKQ